MSAAHGNRGRELPRSIAWIVGLVALVQVLLPLAQNWHLHEHAREHGRAHGHDHSAHTHHSHAGHDHPHDHDHPADPSTPHGDETCPTCELFHGLKAATLPPSDAGPVRLTAAPGDWVHPSDLATPSFLVPADVRPRGPPSVPAA